MPHPRHYSCWPSACEAHHYRTRTAPSFLGCSPWQARDCLSTMTRLTRPGKTRREPVSSLAIARRPSSRFTGREVDSRHKPRCHRPSASARVPQRVRVPPQPAALPQPGNGVLPSARACGAARSRALRRHHRGPSAAQDATDATLLAQHAGQPQSQSGRSTPGGPVRWRALGIPVRPDDCSPHQAICLLRPVEDSCRAGRRCREADVLIGTH